MPKSKMFNISFGHDGRCFKSRRLVSCTLFLNWQPHDCCQFIIWVSTTKLRQHYIDFYDNFKWLLFYRQQLVSALCHSSETLNFQQTFCKNLKSHIVNKDVSCTVTRYVDNGNGEGNVPIRSMNVYGGVKELNEMSGQLQLSTT